MAVTLTYISGDQNDLRVPPGTDDTTVMLFSPSGHEKQVTAEGSNAKVSLVEIGLWEYLWLPSTSEGEINVIPKPDDVARGALAATVPVSSLSSRTA